MKAKLLELIQSCIENPVFYNENSKTEKINFEYPYRNGDYYTVERELEKDRNIGKYIDINHDEYWKVKNSIKFENEKLPFRVEAVRISFEEMPTLCIRLNRLTFEEAIVETHKIANLTEGKKFKNSAFARFFTGKSIPMVEYHLYERKRTFNAEIIFGSIKAEITIEEFNKIIRTIIDNKLKYPLQNDVDALNTRIAKYKK